MSASSYKMRYPGLHGLLQHSLCFDCKCSSSWSAITSKVSGIYYALKQLHAASNSISSVAMEVQQSLMFTGTCVHAMQRCSQHCENTFSHMCWELIFVKWECSPAEIPHTIRVCAIKYHFLKEPVRLVSAKKSHSSSSVTVTICELCSLSSRL